MNERSRLFFEEWRDGMRGWEADRDANSFPLNEFGTVHISDGGRLPRKLISSSRTAHRFVNNSRRTLEAFQSPAISFVSWIGWKSLPFHFYRSKFYIRVVSINALYTLHHPLNFYYRLYSNDSLSVCKWSRFRWITDYATKSSFPWLGLRHTLSKVIAFLLHPNFCESICGKLCVCGNLRDLWIRLRLTRCLADQRQT